MVQHPYQSEVNLSLYNLKEKGEGTRQRTHMNDSQMCTTVLELTVGVGGGMGRGGQRRGN